MLVIYKVTLFKVYAQYLIDIIRIGNRIMYSSLSFSNYTLRFLDINPHTSKTIFLLHGLGVNATSWELQFPALSDAGYRIIAPDARGFGQSTFGRKLRRIEDLASDVAKIIESLVNYPVSVAGISLGGLISLQIGLDYPQLLNKLILINAFAQLRPQRLDQWLYMFARFVAVHTVGIETQAKLVSHRIFPFPYQDQLRQSLVEQIRQADPRAYRAVMRAIARFDVRNRLAELTVPTLVLTGENDTTVSPASQKILVEEIRNNQHVMIPNAGHAAIIDQPDLVNQSILKFLL